MSRIKVQRALISVSDKAGLPEFAAALTRCGVELVASGGTAAAITAAGMPVTRVEQVTGAAEMLDGRVKTLHPSIHAAILADLDRADHRDQLHDAGLSPIQLVVVNLYPFEDGVAGSDITEAEAIELIDIGGPTLVRAAAKNHRWVGVVTDPAQYEEVAAAVAAGGLEPDLRRSLARAAFFRTASYDAAIVGWLEADEPPGRIVLPLERRAALRYGENPHQPAALYAEGNRPAWWQKATQLQGKEMSFNNYLDTEAAWRLVNDFADPAAVIVKHANPCGVAVDDGVESAFRRAWDCDPLAAFGGIVAVNRRLDGATSRLIARNFVEVVIAPQVDPEAATILAEKKNLRLLTAPPADPGGLDLRRMEGGFVGQARDRYVPASSGPLPDGWEQATAERLTSELVADLEFAWIVAGHTKSNAIVVANNRAAVGIGAGDQARVGAVRRALEQAGERAAGAVVASDGFFPFRDAIDVLAGSGAVAVVQPGGSIRDEEIIAAAAEHGIAMILTSRRHFRH